jgi:hypothetical protein
MLMLDDRQGSPGRRADDEQGLRARLADRIFRHLPGPGDHDAAVPGLSFYRRDQFCEPTSALYEPSLSLVIQGASASCSVQKPMSMARAVSS